MLLFASITIVQVKPSMTSTHTEHSMTIYREITKTIKITPGPVGGGTVTSKYVMNNRSYMQ